MISATSASESGTARPALANGGQEGRVVVHDLLEGDRVIELTDDLFEVARLHHALRMRQSEPNSTRSAPMTSTASESTSSQNGATHMCCLNASTGCSAK